MEKNDIVSNKINSEKNLEISSNIDKNKEIEELKNKGNFYMKNSDYKTAITYYEKGLKLDSKNYIILSNLSEAYIKLNYYSKSKIYAELSIKNNPTYIKSFYRKLKSLIGLRNFESAYEFSKSEIFDTISGISEIRKNLEIKYNNTKGIYNFSEMLKLEKENFNLDIGDYRNSKLKIENDDKKGIKIIAESPILKGELLLVSKAIIAKRASSVISLSINEESNLLTDREILSKELYNKINNSVYDYKEVFFLYNGENLNENYSERGKKISEGIKKYENIYNVFKHNAIESLRSLLKDRTVAIGLWPFASFINHSCLSNCYYYGIGDCLIFIAERNIKTNEEITINYISCEYEYFIRQNNLLYGWGFNCDCELCTYEKNYLEKSLIKIQFNKYFRNMQNCISDPKFLEEYLKNNRNEIYEIPIFLEKNKEKFNNYEMGIGFYLYYFIVKNVDKDNCYLYLIKSLNYIKGNYFRYECSIYYFLCLYFKNICKNNEKYIEFYNSLFECLYNVFSKDKKYIEMILEEADLFI